MTTQQDKALQEAKDRVAKSFDSSDFNSLIEAEVRGNGTMGKTLDSINKIIDEVAQECASSQLKAKDKEIEHYKKELEFSDMAFQNIRMKALELKSQLQQATASSSSVKEGSAKYWKSEFDSQVHKNNALQLELNTLKSSSGERQDGKLPTEGDFEREMFKKLRYSHGEEGLIKACAQIAWIFIHKEVTPLLTYPPTKQSAGFRLDEVMNWINENGKTISTDEEFIGINKDKFKKYLFSLSHQSTKRFELEDRIKLQKAYDEIWKTQSYPIETKGKPKSDDILKKYFPDLKPDDKKFQSLTSEQTEVCKCVTAIERGIDGKCLHCHKFVAEHTEVKPITEQTIMEDGIKESGILSKGRVFHDQEVKEGEGEFNNWLKESKWVNASTTYCRCIGENGDGVPEFEYKAEYKLKDEFETEKRIMARNQPAKTK